MIDVTTTMTITPTSTVTTTTTTPPVLAPISQPISSGTSTPPHGAPIGTIETPPIPIHENVYQFCAMEGIVCTVCKTKICKSKRKNEEASFTDGIARHEKRHRLNHGKLTSIEARRDICHCFDLFITTVVSTILNALQTTTTMEEAFLKYVGKKLTYAHCTVCDVLVADVCHHRGNTHNLFCNDAAKCGYRSMYEATTLVPPLQTTPPEPHHPVIQKYGVRFLFDNDSNDRQTGPNNICHESTITDYTSYQEATTKNSMYIQKAIDALKAKQRPTERNSCTTVNTVELNIALESRHKKHEETVDGCIVEQQTETAIGTGVAVM